MYTTLEEAMRIKLSGCRKIAIKKELYSDSITTIDAVRKLKSASREVFLLESAERDMRTSRWSFLGYDPLLEFSVRDDQGRIRKLPSDETEYFPCPDPAAVIRQILEENRMSRQEGFPPFSGGLVGFFSYDAIQYSEPVLSPMPSEGIGDAADIDLMLFRYILAFDSFRQRLIIMTLIDAEDLPSSYDEGIRRLKDAERLIRSSAEAYFPPLQLKSGMKLSMTDQEYAGMVERARRHIVEGDIFQIVLSRSMTAEAEGSLLDVYRVLRSSNPSPYMFYFSSSRIEVAGSSPETLLRIEDDEMMTYPLAGTRKRGLTDAEDKAIEAELLSDEKENAEHNMLVDLGRNDLGRVAEAGSVRVERLREVLRFSHVMHIASEVRGRLAHDKDALDALFSVLPAGTLSGAPKIRACQLISELEGKRRGLYGGAFGYIDFSGNLDSAIAIRLAYKSGGTLCIQSGAGIVYDSDGLKEAEECSNKARAVLEAVREAEGGLDDNPDR